MGLSGAVCHSSRYADCWGLKAAVVVLCHSCVHPPAVRSLLGLQLALVMLEEEEEAICLGSWLARLVRRQDGVVEVLEISSGNQSSWLCQGVWEEKIFATYHVMPVRSPSVKGNASPTYHSVFDVVDFLTSVCSFHLLLHCL